MYGCRRTPSPSVQRFGDAAVCIHAVVISSRIGWWLVRCGARCGALYRAVVPVVTLAAIGAEPLATCDVVYDGVVVILLDVPCSKFYVAVGRCVATCDGQLAACGCARRFGLANVRPARRVALGACACT